MDRDFALLNLHSPGAPGEGIEEPGEKEFNEAIDA